MQNMKKLIVIGIVLVVGIGVCGCGMKKNNNESQKSSNKSELVLNERQKEILEEVGLSTKEEELTYSQKEAIIAIDEMLTEIEKKYNTSFSYAGYVEQGLLESEHLIAYPSDGNPRTDSFEVRKTDNGYEDDYMNVAIREGFSSYLTNIAKQVFKIEEIKAFVEVTETTLVEVPSDEKMYNDAVGSKNYIYIDSSFINEQEFQSYVDELENVLYQNELYGISEIVLLKKDEIEYLNEYNYLDYDISDSYIEWKEISVQEYKRGEK